MQLLLVISFQPLLGLFSNLEQTYSAVFFRKVSMTSVSSSEAVSCEAIDLSRGHNLAVKRARLTRQPDGFHVTLEDDEGNSTRIEIEESVDDNSQQASSTTEVVDLDNEDVNDEVIRTFLLQKHLLFSRMTYTVLY